MSLERLLRPRSIAVFGGGPAEQAVLQSDRMGFAGAIWPVHPTRDTIQGRPCFRSVADLPEAPDAAFVGVNRDLTIDIVGALGRRGAGGAVCYASGFGETGDGQARQAALVAAAGAMPILGPNCYGLINYLDGALLWPDQHGGKRVDRGVAIVTQSSNIAINMTMQRRGLPIAYVATAGNQAQTGLAEIAQACLDDGRVTAIGLHVEAVGDVQRFEAMARRARALGKPVVAITVGRSREARAAAISHTASIAGSEAATAAFFARLGIPRLASIPAFLETLKLLHVHGPLPGGDLLSMSCSGGEAAIMADAASGRTVRFRPFEPAERARVAATLSPMVAVANPLDYHTFTWAKAAAMTETFAAAIGCGFDLSLLVLDFPRADRCSDADWDIAVSAILAAAECTSGRTAVVATMAENLPERRAEALIAGGVVPLCGIDDALAAAEAAAFIGETWRDGLPEPVLARKRQSTLPEADAASTFPLRGGRERPAQRGAAGRGSATGTAVEVQVPSASPPPGPADAGLDHPSRGRLERLSAGFGLKGPQYDTLTESEAKVALAAFGVPIPDGREVSGPDEALVAGEAIGFPVAVKALGVAHKSEAGAVALDVTRDALPGVMADMPSPTGRWLVEAIVTDAVAELLVGVARDPRFGLLMTIAAGGVLVELLGDARSLLLPSGDAAIRAAILSLKTVPLLQGFRGRPVGDLEAAVAAAAAIGRYAGTHAGVLAELEVNPLLVRPDGQGVVAVDALIRMRSG